MTKREATRYKRELVQFIQDNNLTKYADLMDAVMAGAGPQEWFDVASSNTLFFTAYLKSRRFRGFKAKLDDDEELEEDLDNEDLVHVDGYDAKRDDPVMIETYAWDSEVGDYILIKREIPPEC